MMNPACYATLVISGGEKKGLSILEQALRFCASGFVQLSEPNETAPIVAV